MSDDRSGEIAVIFASRRTDADEPGYAAATQAMEALAAIQPGYRGIVSTRGADGFGITVSWWESDDAARVWRDHPEHRAIREQGRALWYDSYEIAIARVERNYAWAR